MSSSKLAHNEKQYAYVAGFQRTIVSKLHKCFFLAQCFNLPQKPAIIAYCMLSVLFSLFHKFFSKNSFFIFNFHKINSDL